MIKAVNFIIEQPNTSHRIAKRFRIPAPRGQYGEKQKFTAEGIENVLTGFITKFDEQNPGHFYRLVSLGRATFKFVWEPPLTPVVTTAEAVAQMLEDVNFERLAK